MKSARYLTAITMAGLVGSSLAGPAMSQDNDPRQDATEATKSANNQLLDMLPFDDNTDFENAKRGLVAPLPNPVIKGDSGNVIWNSKQYDFIAEGAPAPDTTNPSLWRQSTLVNMAGLFKVTDGVYQIRNQDLSNMTIIEGNEGITIVDPMVSAETARAGLNLYYSKQGNKPVKAVIYTHSHVDHYGGVKGVTSEDDVASGKTKIYAPDGFMEEAVSENVFAGTAMSRRASYMYGNLLPADPKGQIGAGLGMNTSAGTVTLIAPTNTISETGQTENIDGLTYEFLMAPGSEAPSEMLFYIQEKKLLDAAEDVTHTLHNTYSLRGAKIRDPLAWSKYINEALGMWGDKTDVLIAQHHWPTWDNNNVVDLMETQRDLYRYINDQTLHMINEGMTLNEIAEQFKLPDSLATHWANRGYYGSVYHDVKATYVLYLGWFDGNPATLQELPPTEAGKHYVEFMGGADGVLEKARQSYEDGDYRWVAQVVSHVVFADPDNQDAKNLEADALEQLGYQAESGPWRNFYLTGAKELRTGVEELPAPNTASPDTIKGMTPEMFFDYMAVRLDSQKAGDASIALNFDFGEEDGKYLVELQNGVLNNTADAQSDNADATITLSRETMDNIVLKQTTMDKAISSGDVTIDGDQAKLTELVSYLDDFEFWFNIVTP